MAELKFSHENIVKLINNYSQFECLWNYRSPEYKRLDKKRNAWDQLSKEFNKSVEDLKRKVKYLRNAYVLEKKKVDESRKSGASAGSIYHSNLFYFEDFKFLDSAIILRKTKSNFEVVCNVDGGETEGIEDVIPESMELFSQPAEPHSLGNSSQATSTATSSGRSKKRLCRASSPNFEEAVDAIVRHATQTLPVPEEGEYSAFGKNVAFQLSQLTPYEATINMSKIHNLLSQAILQSMSSNRYSSATELSNESDSCDRLQTALNFVENKTMKGICY